MDDKDILQDHKSMIARAMDHMDPSIMLHDVVYLWMSVLVGGLLVAWFIYLAAKGKDMTTWGDTMIWILAVTAGAKTVGDGSIKLPFMGGGK